jgi:hypothetical protein
MDILATLNVVAKQSTIQCDKQDLMMKRAKSCKNICY